MNHDDVENFLDKLFTSSPIAEVVAFSAFLGSVASRIGADVCFESTKSSEYTEANKRLTRIQLQLEHYERRFSELSEIFSKISAGIDFDKNLPGNEKAGQILELFIDFQKHNNEIISMLRTVAEYSLPQFKTVVVAAVNSVQSAAENITFILNGLSVHFEKKEFYKNGVKRNSMLYEDILKLVEQAKKLL